MCTKGLISWPRWLLLFELLCLNNFLEIVICWDQLFGLNFGWYFDLGSGSLHAVRLRLVPWCRLPLTAFVHLLYAHRCLSSFTMTCIVLFVRWVVVLALILYSSLSFPFDIPASHFLEPLWYLCKNIFSYSIKGQRGRSLLIVAHLWRKALV